MCQNVKFRKYIFLTTPFSPHRVRDVTVQASGPTQHQPCPLLLLLVHCETKRRSGKLQFMLKCDDADIRNIIIPVHDGCTGAQTRSCGFDSALSCYKRDKDHLNSNAREKRVGCLFGHEVWFMIPLQFHVL